MIKVVFVLLVSAFLIEGKPFTQDADILDLDQNDNWKKFQELFQQSSFGDNIPPLLLGSVESLKPSDDTHVFGHSVFTYKEIRNDNGKVDQKSKGVEILNTDGEVSKRVFTP